MQTIWVTVDYLADRARSRVRSIVRNEAGALTLEWIIIAVALVAAGAIAAGLFTAAIRTEARKLP